MASVAVDDELHQRLKKVCFYKRISIKHCVSKLISEWLEKHEKEIG